MTVVHVGSIGTRDMHCCLVAQNRCRLSCDGTYKAIGVTILIVYIIILQ